MRNTINQLLPTALLLLLWSTPAGATKIVGRYSLGYFVSQERFTNSLATGSNKNDSQILSGRLYLRAEEIGTSRYELVTDIRDKHDFFDRLNRERLSLDSRNELQLRQLSLRLPLTTERTLGSEMGRFAVLDAGAAFVDGAKIDLGLKPGLRFSLFGGLNPKQEGRSYLKFDAKASILGLSSVYDAKSPVWSRNIYLAHALVDQTYDGHLDRRYLFHNLIYQWQNDSRFVSLAYFDFAPRSHLQSGFFSWQQRWGESTSTEITHLAFDVIEYSRRQGLLERLPTSPYSENGAKFSWRTHGRDTRLQVQVDQGRRAVDGLTKQSVEVGAILSKVLSPNYDFYGTLGTRRNFTSDDVFSRMGVGYYSRVWELNLDSSLEVHANRPGTLTGNRDKTHPIMVDSTLAYYFSRALYLAGSLQHAHDEDVTIWSAFFRLGYRFGDREIPPIRDGAPPRGAL